MPGPEDDERGVEHRSGAEIGRDRVSDVPLVARAGVFADGLLYVAGEVLGGVGGPDVRADRLVEIERLRQGTNAQRVSMSGLDPTRSCAARLRAVGVEAAIEILA